MTALGRCHILENRERFLLGKLHTSQSDFPSRDRREPKTGNFAASLLTPEEQCLQEA
jgi:hypothetical protein